MFYYLLNNKMRVLLIFLGVFLIEIALWVKIKFGLATLDQVISTFALNSWGILRVDFDLIFSFLIFIFLSLFIILSFFYIEHYLQKKFFITLSKKYLSLVPIVLVTFGLYSIAHVFNLPDYINYLYWDTQDNSPDYFAQEYQNPKDIQLDAKKPNNLILIYLESFEITYSNKQIFKRDLLAKLANLKPGSISFNKFEQVSGASWSIAGLVASQCGIPLKLTSVFGGNTTFSLTPHFLSNATCLSDILAAWGYHNVFLKGASLQFAGFDNFLKTHHYQEMYGREEWLGKGLKKNQMIGWGLPDDLLFQQARKVLQKLVADKKPFNLTVFTLDSHGPHGQLNNSCRKRGGKNFEDIIECTANEVAEFINFIEKRGWFKNLTIVIMGDHLAMENSVSNKINLSKNRYIFNIILNNPEPLVKNTNLIVHYDLFPTILSALGFTFPGNKLALGRTATGKIHAETAISERPEKLNIIANRPSPTYNRLWRLDKPVARF